MLLLIDGFDLVDATGAPMKYNAFFTQFLQQQMLAGRPGPANSGPPGQSLWIFNSAFGDADYFIIPPAGFFGGVIGFHMDIAFRTTAQNRTRDLVDLNLEFFRVMAGPTLLFSLSTLAGDTNGRLTAIGSGGGTLGVYGGPIYYDTWYTLEAKIRCGASGGFEVRINRSTVLSGPSFTSLPPDRAGFLQKFFGPPGPNIDNYVLWDANPSDGFSDFLGPCRVTSYFPIMDIGSGWIPTPQHTATGAVSDVPGVSAQSPDGDLSYAIANGAGARQLFTMSQVAGAQAVSPCFGKNLALAINACVRPTDDNTPSHQGFDLLARPRVTVFPIASVRPVAVGEQFMRGFHPNLTDYAIYQAIAAKSPESAGVWTDVEIASAAFGLQLHAVVPDTRWTQFNVEKLTTTIPGVPFSCGQSSYVF